MVDSSSACLGRLSRSSCVSFEGYARSARFRTCAWPLCTVATQTGYKMVIKSMFYSQVIAV
jgi:hypothetical protein